MKLRGAAWDTWDSLKKPPASKQNKTNSRQIDFKSDSHFTLCFNFLPGNEAETNPSYLEMWTKGLVIRKYYHVLEQSCHYLEWCSPGAKCSDLEPSSSCTGQGGLSSILFLLSALVFLTIKWRCYLLYRLSQVQEINSLSSSVRQVWSQVQTASCYPLPGSARASLPGFA